MSSDPGGTDWAAELDDFQPSAGVGKLPGAAARGKAHAAPPPTERPAAATTAEDLKAEMKLLHWHKLANEAALKAALIRTKKLRERDGDGGGGGGKESFAAKAAWMQRVIEEEQSKPLQVSKDFISQYERQEALDAERLEKEVERHISCLKALRDKVQARDKLRERKEKYRRARSELDSQRQAHLERMRASAKSVTGAVTPLGSSASPDKAGGSAIGRRSMKDTRTQVQGTLTAVITSLDKLVDLERRISSLEKNSVYDTMTRAAGGSGGGTGTGGAAGGGGGGGGGGLQFSKRRGAGGNGQPSRTLYSVRVGRGAGSGGPGGQRGTKRSAGGAQGGGSTFLTQGANKSPKKGHFPRGPAGRRQKQDSQVRDWLGGRRKVPARGAASGRKGKTAPMQQFHELRGQMEKRKDELRRRMAAGTSGSSNANSRTAPQRRGGGGGGTTRFPSTAPGGRGKAATSRASTGARTTGRARGAATSLPRIKGGSSSAAGGGLRGVRAQRAVRQAW